jgi:hypothetical protein
VIAVLVQVRMLGAVGMLVLVLVIVFLLVAHRIPPRVRRWSSTREPRHPR